MRALERRYEAEKISKVLGIVSGVSIIWIGALMLLRRRRVGGRGFAAGGAAGGRAALPVRSARRGGIRAG